MRLKKSLLAIGMALALLTFAAPAQAQSWWTIDVLEEEDLEIFENDPFSGSGTVTMTTGTGFVTGPMEVVVNGYLSNGPRHGEGTFVAGFLGNEIPTSITGCKATAVVAVNTPWSIFLETEVEERVELGELTISFVYGAFCQGFGVPGEVPFIGVITAEYNNASGCFVFKKAGNLTVEGGSLKATLDGSICITGEEELGKFTAYPHGGE
jgi:MFS family permease